MCLCVYMHVYFHAGACVSASVCHVCMCGVPVCICMCTWVWVCVCLSHPVLGSGGEWTTSEWKERLDLIRVIYIDWQGARDFWGGIGASNSSTCQAANRRYREWLWLVRVSHKPTSWSPSPRKDLWELSRKNSVGICVLGGSSHPTQPCFSSLHTATSVLWFLNFLLYF